MVRANLQAESSNVTPDTAILHALYRYRAACEAYNALLSHDGAGRGDTPAELAYIDIMDAAEIEVKSALATIAWGVEVKLWLALLSGLAAREDDEAARNCDLDYFSAKESQLHWDLRVILSAIVSLRAMHGLELLRTKEEA